jgi:hypothetical protein
MLRIAAVFLFLGLGLHATTVEGTNIVHTMYGFVKKNADQHVIGILN